MESVIKSFSTNENPLRPLIQLNATHAQGHFRRHFPHTEINGKTASPEKHLPPCWRRPKANKLICLLRLKDAAPRLFRPRIKASSLSLAAIVTCLGRRPPLACVCICEWAKGKRKSNLQQLPTHVSLSTLFKLGEKAASDASFLPLSAALEKAPAREKETAGDRLTDQIFPRRPN